jgi:Na+/H+-dicarboxylate symporter/ABC-type amino acid transport substrate-binding protein
VSQASLPAPEVGNEREGASDQPKTQKRSKLSVWIALGLLLGIVCGLLFGDYCGHLKVFGQAYVGLLQMTVLPYLLLSLVAKMGRLDPAQAKKLGLVTAAVLLAFWVLAILLIVIVSLALPEIPGASFFSPAHETSLVQQQDFVTTFIPTNVFRALANEYVPAVVVFCLFFGAALMMTPEKEPVLDFLDLCASGISRVNLFLIRIAPLGLFALTAAAAGTMQFEELSRLQAYLLIFVVASAVATFGALPLFVTSLTHIRYRDLIRAAHEPMLTAIATGKLFVVLPQICERAEQLLHIDSEGSTGIEDSTPSILVPLAYPFPHVGKIFAFLFVSFAAWYVGDDLGTVATAEMAATGVVSSFASPLVSIPYMLDKYQLPQDLMALFILPGFITTRIADVVGVMHLMALTLIVTQVLQGKLRVRLARLAVSMLVMGVCLLAICAAGRWYLASTKLDYTLDQQFLALGIPQPHTDVVVYESSDEVPPRSFGGELTLERLTKEKILRVGYRARHLPYSYFNQRNELVGFDVELMHRLASRLAVRLEFVPYTFDTLIEQLDSGEIDVAMSGLVIKPERLLQVGFSRPYQRATVSIVVRDHRRDEFDAHALDGIPDSVRKLGTDELDAAKQARLRHPDVEFEVVDSIQDFFDGERQDLDGLILPAEEGAAWNVLYPDHSVVIPTPEIHRPVGLAVRKNDGEWVRLLDRFLDFEEMDGTLQQLREYWVEGGGTKEQKPRWCVLRNVLHWLP